MARPAMPCACALACLCVAFGALAQAPLRAASGPTSQPSHAPVPATTIRTYLDRLADGDARIRDKAAEDLMALSADDLPTLVAVVKDCRPLRPSQTTALRDVVLHVFISGQAYARADGDAPFLGVGWNLNQVPATEDGIEIGKRYAGFPAYRMLRDGDVIAGIYELPGTKFPTTEAFSIAIGSFHVGQTIRLEVIRDGRTIRVPVQLGARPSMLPDQLNEWETDQQAAADEYWDHTFGPLVDDAMS